MGDNSAIEWTDATWNPLRGTVGRWTCSKISDGCTNCYASSMNRRFGGSEYPRVGEPRVDTVWLDERVLTQPSRWKRPRMIFVCSMTDLFEESVPYTWVEHVFWEMMQNRQHTYQVLTKRPGRMLEFWRLSTWGLSGQPVPPHIWIGATIELDRYSWRAEKLRQIPAAVRFVSAEPLLGPLPSLDLTGIHWVITGGESGHGARPMHPDWARDLRDRCQEAGVAYFHKQWGEWAHPWQVTGLNSESINPSGARLVHIDGTTRPYTPRPGGTPHPWCYVERIGKHKAGRLLDGREHNEMPAVQP